MTADVRTRLGRRLATLQRLDARRNLHAGIDGPSGDVLHTVPGRGFRGFSSGGALIVPRPSVDVALCN